MGERMTFEETTNPTLSNHDVGIANIWERELPDEHGVIAHRMSAVLFIHDPATGEQRRETVVAGSVVAIGGDRYCIIEVAYGAQGGNGHVIVERAVP